MAGEPKLTLAAVREAVGASAAALRLTLKFDAVSPKVFPPTYEGGKYATESRRINGQEVPCALLDSVPSQANRMELAIQEAWEGGEVELRVIAVDSAAVNLVRVPEEEADAKEAEYQREQAKKPKRGPSPSGAPSPTLRPGNRSVRLSCEAITDG